MGPGPAESRAKTGGESQLGAAAEGAPGTVEARGEAQRPRVQLSLVLDLVQAAEAHRQLEGRGTVGKVVLRVP